MNLCLHHNAESGSAPALTGDSPLSEQSSTELLPFTFTPTEARHRDITTGLQHNLNRWYDPTLGLWIGDELNGYDGNDEKNGQRWSGTA